jgi:hypothetical protein
VATLRADPKHASGVVPVTALTDAPRLFSHGPGTISMPDAKYRLEEVLADIKRLHRELQSQETRSQELQSQEMRPAWQPFALGFAIGSVFFAAVIAFVKFHP